MVRAFSYRTPLVDSLVGAARSFVAGYLIFFSYPNFGQDTGIAGLTIIAASIFLWYPLFAILFWDFAARTGSHNPVSAASAAIFSGVLGVLFLIYPFIDAANQAEKFKSDGVLWGFAIGIALNVICWLFYKSRSRTYQDPSGT